MCLLEFFFIKHNICFVSLLKIAITVTTADSNVQMIWSRVVASLKVHYFLLYTPTLPPKGI